MARKKIVEVKVEENEPKNICLSKVQVMELRAYEAEAKVHELQSLLFQKHKEEVLRQLDPNGILAKLDNDINAFRKNAQDARKLYQEVMKNIETQLNIKLSDYSYDELTGQLVPQNN